MDEAKLLEEFTPYVRQAAKYFVYDSLRSRVDYEDLLQEGLLTLIVLHEAGRDTSPKLIRHAVWTNMLGLVLKNYSQLHVTTHAFKKTTCEKTRALTTASLYSIPLQEIVSTPKEGQNSGLILEDDVSGLFVRDYLNSLTEREHIVCMALMEGMPEREIAKESGIPYITVRRTHAKLKEKLREALEDEP